ncbi:hypothetical protein BKA69DRAFT_1122016 [Paraphysoderma sedebokerense]|nr:hypothetical protein BKA69DRAFT_1122016 [Paraphysoderma sedebokerense]
MSVTVPTLVALVVHRKRQNLLIDHSLDAFNKILNDRRLFAEFKQSLAEDFCIENGLFWEDWMEARQSLKNSVKHVQTIFPTSANLELNVTATTKKKIAESIEQNILAAEIFAEAKAEVFQMMYLNSFPRFILKLRQRAAYPSSSIHTSGKNFEITAV